MRFIVYNYVFTLIVTPSPITQSPVMMREVNVAAAVAISVVLLLLLLLVIGVVVVGLLLFRRKGVD